MLWNIKSDTGKIMLGQWTDRRTAKQWLAYYIATYANKPYPNGRGYYRCTFELVHRKK